MSRKRILYILHCYYNIAGTEEHTRALAVHLGEDYECFIAFPDKDRIVLLLNGKEIREYSVPHVPWPVSPYRSPQHEAALDSIISEVKPECIHVQHFIHWHLGLLGQIVKTSVPAVISFHDYFAITPDFTMQGVDGPQVTTGPNYARQFLGGDISSYLIERRNILASSIRDFSVRVVPSEFLRSVMAEIFPMEYQIINHGIPPFKKLISYSSEHIRFGYLGSLLPQKGYQGLLEAFSLLKSRYQSAELFIFGGGENVNIPAQDGVVFKGGFSSNDLPEIMRHFDVGIIPSMFRETFCLVLSELWYAGIPVAASRIGALGERVEDGVNGYLFQPGNIEEIKGVLERFILDDSWKRWHLPHVRLVDEMLSDYRNLYQEVIGS